MAGALGMLALAAPAPAQTGHAVAAIDSITVRWRDEAIPLGQEQPPQRLRAALDSALRLPLAPAGRTRDGAFRYTLAQPAGIDAARAAINRVRLLPDVLYASLGETAAAAQTGRKTAAAAPAQASEPLITRLIVKYRDPSLAPSFAPGGALGTTSVDRLSTLSGQGVEPERPMSGGAWVVRLSTPLSRGDAESLARTLESDPEIEYAEPDRWIQATLVPNDASFAQQWDLMPAGISAGGANLPAAWDLTVGAPGIVVAIVDTGILPHPDLAGRYIAGYDMISDSRVANDASSRDADASDAGDWVTGADNAGTTFSGFFRNCAVRNSSWHGTHVAGTIGAAANNGAGVAGINWVSRILPVRALGKCGGFTSDIADGIRWAVGLPVVGAPLNPNPARVVNLSLGSLGTCGTTFQSAINAALAANAVVAVAAGNSNNLASLYQPAGCAGVITVAATQGSGARSSYSNYGAAVEIAAPGGGDGNYVLSTLNRGTTTPILDGSGWSYANYQGTSMATPHVAGIVSLMLSVNPSLTPAQVLSKLQTSARAFPTGTIRDCTTSLCGAGIVDASAAVAAATLDVRDIATVTTLAASENPATQGDVVSLTATVNGIAPTGTVAFKDSGSSIATCGAVPLSGGGNTRTAACDAAGLAVGVHSLAATYSGDAVNGSSTSAALSQVVTPPAPTVTLASSLNPAPPGASITFTATVTGMAPTGAVTFSDGSAAIDGCTAMRLAGSGDTRTALCTTTFDSGTHRIVASYSGDGANGPAVSAALAEQVARTRRQR